MTEGPMRWCERYLVTTYAICFAVSCLLHWWMHVSRIGCKLSRIYNIHLYPSTEVLLKRDNMLHAASLWPRDCVNVNILLLVPCGISSSTPMLAVRTSCARWSQALSDSSLQSWHALMNLQPFQFTSLLPLSLWACQSCFLTWRRHRSFILRCSRVYRLLRKIWPENWTKVTWLENSGLQDYANLPYFHA